MRPFFVGVLQVARVLGGGRDPAVANEETFDVPVVIGSGGVAGEDRIGYVGDVLACVGFTCYV